MLIHHVRAEKYGALEPVGIWAVRDDDFDQFYPPEFAQFEKRGAKALLGRPGSIPLVEWAHYKVDTSPNWRRHVPQSLFDEPTDLEVVFASIRANFELKHETTASHSEFLRKCERW